MASKQARRLSGRPGQLVHRAVSLAESRRGIAVVFLVALAAWWLEALAMPLAQGRDLGTYLGGYIELFQRHPVDLGYVLGRTPGATLLIGGLLQFSRGALAEPVVSLLYAASIAAWFVTARIFSTRAALLTALVLLLYPGYAVLFHELSSDAIFGAAFAGFALLVVRAFVEPSVGRFASAGVGIGVLSLIRPGNQVLLVLALLPLVLRGAWRARLVWTAAFVLPAVVLLGGWALHNGLRYDNYTVARGGNATVPFFRTFVTDKIVRPSNGPASRELARVVKHELLPKEPYRSYGITLDDFFSKASPRMQVDLLALSDRHKGWHSNYKWLRDVGIEAVRTHKARYVRGVAGSMSGMLRVPLYRAASSAGTQTPPETVDVGGVVLPVPSEGEPIPAAHEGGVTTPDGSIYTVWTSPSQHHLVFVHPGAKQRYNALHRRIDELAQKLPDRRGSPWVVRRVNDASRWFPPPVLWLALALVALVWRRPRRWLSIGIPVAAALLVILLTALGLPAESHYAVPVAPAFVFAAFAGLFVRRREPAAAGELLEAAALRRLAGAVLGGAAALWAVLIYYDTVHAGFSAERAPHDLAVFLRAAGSVLHGHSPYAYRGDETYAYPPLAALLAAPLHPLGAGAATLLWTLLSLAAIGLAVWVLGVRDWRCYALVAVYPVTRSAVDLGTIGPFLLLAVALVWRWRSHVWRAGAAAGLSVALKLFLWPLGVWFALTGRIRAALAAAGFALLFVLLPWASLGFDGLLGYPGLLRHLAHDEATSSYSLVAVGVRLHLPESVATALALLIAAALLFFMASVARGSGRSPRDRDTATFTIMLAVSLAASPIVWVHYLLLLVVPIALTRHRLSLLWFVPFAYAPLGESAWPAGDTVKLGLALVTTTVILLAGVYPSLHEGRLRGARRRLAEARPPHTRARPESGAARPR
ncbi:MAG: glycosyltransferase 87 family protein [Gaiellaceae bacterium]